MDSTALRCRFVFRRDFPERWDGASEGWCSQWLSSNQSAIRMQDGAPEDGSVLHGQSPWSSTCSRVPALYSDQQTDRNVNLHSCKLLSLFLGFLQCFWGIMLRKTPWPSFWSLFQTCDEAKCQDLPEYDLDDEEMEGPAAITSELLTLGSTEQYGRMTWAPTPIVRRDRQRHTHTHKYIYIYIYTTYIHIMYIYIYKRTHVIYQIYIYISCIYISCVCIYIYIHIYIYTCTYISYIYI